MPQSQSQPRQCVQPHAEAAAESEVQMQLLFAELKRIEGQQQQLKTAVAQNRVLIVHPPKGFEAQSVEDEYAEEQEVKPDPDKFIPSGEHATIIKSTWHAASQCNFCHCTCECQQ